MDNCPIPIKKSRYSITEQSLLSNDREYLRNIQSVDRVWNIMFCGKCTETPKYLLPKGEVME